MRRPMLPLLLAALASTTALALGAAPALAEEAKSRPSFALLVTGEDGDNVRLEINSHWLGALVSAAEIECEEADDRDVREMMASLRRQGEGGVYEYRDRDDGDRVLARRSRGLLKLETRDRDGDRAIVEMPWETADCLMGGVPPEGDLGDRIVKGLASLKVDARDGESRVRLSIE